MPDLRTDAQLVTAYTAGDRGALAGIYDRFSAGLYDTAARMPSTVTRGSRCNAGRAPHRRRAMQPAARAGTAKPWLYAILRNEVYRRTKKRGRALPTDFSRVGAPEVAAPMAPDAEGEALCTPSWASWCAAPPAASTSAISWCSSSARARACRAAISPRSA